MIRKPWKERSSELAVVRRRMRDRLFETGQIPRFVGSGDLLPWLPTCLECLYNVSFLRHRCLSPSSFAHWYSHYFQLANTPSVVYPLEISLFLQFRPPSLPFLLFSFSFSLGEKRNVGFRGFFPTHNDDKQQQSCHEQRLSLRSISTSHYTPCHARGRWQLRKGIKHPLAKAPPKERGNWILRNCPRHLSCIWNFSTYLLRTSGDFFFFSPPKIARFALRVTRVFSEWQAWRRGTRVRNYYRREEEGGKQITPLTSYENYRGG